MWGGGGEEERRIGGEARSGEEVSRDLLAALPGIVPGAARTQAALDGDGRGLGRVGDAVARLGDAERQHEVVQQRVRFERLDQFGAQREQLAGGADERYPLAVFLLAWGFADEEDVRMGIARPEDEICPRMSQRTADALANLLSKGLQIAPGVGPAVRRRCAVFGVCHRRGRRRDGSTVGVAPAPPRRWSGGTY